MHNNRVLKNMAKVLNTDITVLNYNSHDYISLTDMASAKEGDSRAADIIKNWIRNRYTIEFLGTWEMIHKGRRLSFLTAGSFASLTRCYHP